MRLVAGCMTGTSLDGLDAVLAEIEGSGLNVTARLRGVLSRPLGALGSELARLASGSPAAPLELLRAARALGELHAEAADELCRRYGVGRLDLLVAHGQTIWHAPAERLSFQLFDPWPAVRRLRAPVLYDLRQADLAAGGEGAPITPLADWVLYRLPGEPRLIVNLGGIANVTFLPGSGGPEAISARDVVPCNVLLDGLARALFGREFDAGGELAARGRPGPHVVEALRRHPALAGDGRPRSLSRESFGGPWLEELARQMQTALEPNDFLASAADAVASEIAAMAKAFAPAAAIIAGGGARNRFLVERLRKRLEPARLVPSDDLGIPAEAREALAFAVLGALSQDGVPITLPQVTGANAPGRAGAWALP